MRYRFEDILDEDMYKKSSVMLITGPYDIFNNIVIDNLKGSIGEEAFTVPMAISVSSEFGIAEEEDGTATTSVDIDTFIKVASSANINGKWVCVCEYGMLSARQRGAVEGYIRRPSNNGVLIMYSSKFEDYKNIVKSRVFTVSKNVNHIDLRFVNRATFKKIIEEIIRQKGKEINENATKSLMFKINRAYNDTEKIIDMVVEYTDGERITNEDVKNSLKKVENFTAEDFIIELTQGVTNAKVGNKKIYRIMYAMIEQYGAERLVSTLINEIDTYIEFRMYINKGVIPIKINYFYNETIIKVEETSKLRKMTEYTFRKKASIAAQTSIKDWGYMRLILSGALGSHDEMQCIKAIYEVVTRTAMSKSRLNNAISVEDILSTRYKSLDKYKYINREEIANEERIYDSE